MNKEIKIGSRIFKINIDNRTREDNNLGCVYLSKGQIYISEELPKDLEKITLWHEIIHAILEQTDFENVNFGNKKDTEEWICNILSNNLYQIIKDNLWITKK